MAQTEMTRAGIDELRAEEIDAVSGGLSNVNYNVFYTIGYWIGEAASAVGRAAGEINSAYVKGVEQSNGAILAYLG
jgi:hypothetical protein